jgi:type I restriction enzyme S subunit
VPFELPVGWVWSRLGEICDSITYGTSEKCSYESSKNAKVLRIPNVSSGSINDEDLKFTQLSEKSLLELSLNHGDILTIRSNGSPEIVGTMAFVTKDFESYCFAGYLIRLRFFNPIIGQFISKLSKAKFIRCQIEDPLRTTVGINNINTQELSNLIFPLPPIAEQQAIVDRVEKLFSMVDELEKQVSERKVQSEQLMQAVLREAFEGKTSVSDNKAKEMNNV